MKRHIPNLLTGARLILTFVMFAALVASVSFDSPSDRAPLMWVATGSFLVAAITDFFDGYLARKWQVTSAVGAILDPIGDKILVCGAIIGLVAGGQLWLAWPGGLILFREFSVSALREVLAPRGLKLPVTRLAKWKTTLQLLALAAPMLRMSLFFSSAEAFEAVSLLLLIEAPLAWAAAVVTVWTGAEYALAARRALRAKGQAAPPAVPPA